MNTHQPEFFQTADWQFRLCRRRNLNGNGGRRKKSSVRSRDQSQLTLSYEYLLVTDIASGGFSDGRLPHSFLIVWFNCWWFGLGCMVPQDVQTVDGTDTNNLLHLVTLTTLGYGDITPQLKAV